MDRIWKLGFDSWPFASIVSIFKQPSIKTIDSPRNLDISTPIISPENPIHHMLKSKFILTVEHVFNFCIIIDPHY